MLGFASKWSTRLWNQMRDIDEMGFHEGMISVFAWQVKMVVPMYYFSSVFVYFWNVQLWKIKYSYMLILKLTTNQ